MSRHVLIHVPFFLQIRLKAIVCGQEMHRINTPLLNIWCLRCKHKVASLQAPLLKRSNSAGTFYKIFHNKCLMFVNFKHMNHAWTRYTSQSVINCKSVVKPKLFLFSYFISNIFIQGEPFSYTVLPWCPITKKIYTLPAKIWNIFYFSDFVHICGVCRVFLYLKYMPTRRYYLWGS